MAATFVQRLGQSFLRMAEAVHQLPVGGGLLDRIQVGALDILDDRDLDHIGIGKLADDDRQFVQLRHLRRTPAAFAGDDLVQTLAGRVRTHDQRLQHTATAQRIGQFLQGFGVEMTARLIRVGGDLFDRNQAAVPRRRCRDVGFAQIDIGHQRR